MPRKKNHPNSRPPARTRQDRENELISLAVNLAEKQLREGTATAPVITHYLKLGSTRELLEKERLRMENELTQAKTEALTSARKAEELFMQAVSVFRIYSGKKSDQEGLEEDD